MRLRTLGKIASSAMIMLLLLGVTMAFKDMFIHGNHHLLPGQALPLPGAGSQLHGKSFAEDTLMLSFNKAGGGFAQLRGLIFGRGYSTLKTLLGMIAIVSMTYMGIQMIVNNANEEKVTKAKHSILLIFIGLAIVAIADVVVKGVFVMSQGTFLGEGGLAATDEQLRQVQELGIPLSQITGDVTVNKLSQLIFNYRIGIVITFIRYIVQGFAFFFVVRSGIALIVAGQQSDVLEAQKKTFAWGLVGFVFIMASEAIIKNVIFPVEYGKPLAIGGEQIEAGMGLLSQLTNVVLAFAGGVAVFSLIAGAVLYALPGGEDTHDRAKKIIVGSLTGLVIIYSAYTVVAEFIR